MPKLIGLSLSFCVADILRGNVSVEDVVEIIANTRIQNLDAWKDTVENYSRMYWNNDPRASEICEYLLFTGKIKQPRIDDWSAGHYIGGRSHWRTEGLFYEG